MKKVRYIRMTKKEQTLGIERLLYHAVGHGYSVYKDNVFDVDVGTS